MTDTRRPGPVIGPVVGPSAGTGIDGASPGETPTPHSPHRRAWDLIPWVVAGSALEADRAHVESHAAGCAECRAEIEFHSAVRDGLLGADPDVDTSADDTTVDAAWRVMHARLEAEDDARLDDHGPGAAAALPGQRPDRLAANGPWRWLVVGGAAALVLQAVGIVALSAALWLRGAGEAPFQVLSETPGDGAAAPRVGSEAVRLVLAPAATVGELQAGLAAIGWQLAEASGDARLLVVVPGPGAALPREQALAALRGWPHTLLAEPMPSATVPGR